MEPYKRQIRNWYKNNVEIVETHQGEKIANTRVALFNTSTYLDATFSLKLSYGKVAGYRLNTTLVSSKTYFYELYARVVNFNSKPPCNLSHLKKTRQSKVNLPKPVNFVTINDFVGGNSGSPVFNDKG